jgi:thiamine kinase-like enzyme
MMNFLDNQNVLMIDYEYAGWNPMCMDIANYINETTLDNSYPGLNGIQLYPDNFMSDFEIELMSKKYM